MKKLLSLVLLILIGCSSEPINIDEILIERNGVYYTKDTNQLYTGPVFSLYDENGKLSDEKFYRDGKLIVYRQIGQLKSEGTLKDGMWDGSYKSYYINEQLRSEITYKDGKWNGPYKYFYKNGQLQSEGTFIDNSYEGPFREYYENGQLKEEGTMKDNSLDGPYKVYNEDGKLIKEEIR